MTVVIAKKFGDYMLVASDTEITEVGETKRNTIPGALKTFVIDLNCTISFAGNYDQAIETVRWVRSVFMRNRDFDQLLELLRGDTTNKECDYIVAMHRPHAELRKVWEGKVSEPVAEAWIGHSDIASELLSLAPKTIEGVQGLSASQDQIGFYGYQNALTNLNLQQGTKLSDGVGGVLVVQLSSPWGHCYANYAGATSWEIQIDPALQVENDRARATGEKSFGFSIAATPERGVPVVGIFYEQAGAGVVYSPMHEDTPRLEAISLEELSMKVSDIAKSLGGITTDHWQAPGEDFNAIAKSG